MLVSHDRDFLQGLCDKVYEFKDRKIKEYLGDIDFFLEQRNLQNMREAEMRSEIRSEVKTKEVSGKQSYENQKKIKSLTNKLSKIESKIGIIEKKIKTIDVELAVNYDTTISDPNFFDNYQRIKKDLERLMEEWEKVTLEIEVIS